MSLILPNYPDVENTSPFETDESIVTVEASGGSVPYSYVITAPGMLKVTGTVNPDATGIYTENGTYNGEPAYERLDGAYWVWFEGDNWWVISTGKGVLSPHWGGYGFLGDYEDIGGTYWGTATVALYTPFAIDSATGEITIADASGLAVGQTWTLTVRATDSLLDTDLGTVTLTLIEAGTDPNIGRKFALPMFLR